MIGLLSIAIFLPAVLAAPTFLLGRKNPKMAKMLGVGTTAIVFAISILILVVFQYGQPGFQLSESAPWASTFGLNYKVGIDGISLPLLMIATFLSLLSAAGSWDQITFRHAEYYALFLIFETGIIGVFTSLNLILFYLFWEIVLIPMFFFIGIWGGPRRRYASLKFLIFTYSGSAVMLFGFLALYAWAGTSACPGGPSFDYDVLAARIPSLALPLQLVVAITTFFGFAVKLPIFPLHTWLPDAHVEAPAPVSVLLAGLLLKMGGYGLIRDNLLLFPKAVSGLWPYFTTIGLITMIYGASVALVARDIKRMIALTSVNHMGYVLLGALTATVAGVSGAVVQMFSHRLPVDAETSCHDSPGWSQERVAPSLDPNSGRVSRAIIDLWRVSSSLTRECDNADGGEVGRNHRRSWSKVIQIGPTIADPISQPGRIRTTRHSRGFSPV